MNICKHQCLSAIANAAQVLLQLQPVWVGGLGICNLPPTHRHTHMHTRAHIKTLGFHARTRMSTRRVDGEITEILDEGKWLRTSVIQCAVFSSVKPCRRQHFLFTYRSFLSNSHPVHSFLFLPYLHISLAFRGPSLPVLLLVSTSPPSLPPTSFSISPSSLKWLCAGSCGL